MWPSPGPQLLLQLFEVHSYLFYIQTSYRKYIVTINQKAQPTFDLARDGQKHNLRPSNLSFPKEQHLADKTLGCE